MSITGETKSFEVVIVIFILADFVPLAALVTTLGAARKLFSFSLRGVDEVGGYVVAGTGAFGFAYALIERTHTRIDIVLGHVPKPVRNFLNVIAYAMVAGAALFITRFAYLALSESLMFNSHSPTPLQTPMWIPQGIWFLGLVVFSGTALAMFIHLLLQNFKDSGG